MEVDITELRVYQLDLQCNSMELSDVTTVHVLLNPHIYSNLAMKSAFQHK